MSQAWSKGSTRAWRVTRARILLRDGHTCQIRGPRCTTIATQVHHKLGKSISEADCDLEAACANCNYDVGDPRKGIDPAPSPRTKW